MSIKGNNEPKQRMPEVKRLTHNAQELFPTRFRVEYGAMNYLQRQVLIMHPAPAPVHTVVQSENMPSEVSDMVKPLGAPIVQSTVETVAPPTEEYGEFADPAYAAYFAGLPANKEVADA